MIPEFIFGRREYHDCFSVPETRLDQGLVNEFKLERILGTEHRKGTNFCVTNETQNGQPVRREEHNVSVASGIQLRA